MVTQLDSLTPALSTDCAVRAIPWITVLTASAIGHTLTMASHVTGIRTEAPVAPSIRDRNDGAAALDEGSVTPPDGETPTRLTLTDRHLEILGHVARGRTNRQVGELLGISERTVRNHLRTISKRLATTDRTHAVVLAIGRGLIAVPIQQESETPIPGAPQPAKPAS